MITQLWRPTLAGAAALFVWHMLMNFLPWHAAPILTLPGEPAIVDALVATRAEPGTYFLNRLPDALGVGPGVWGWMTLHRAADYSFAAAMLGSVVGHLLVAFGLGWILLRHGPARHAQRIGMVAVMAACGALAGPVSYYNWSWFSLAYASTQVFDWVLGWTIAGAVISRTIGAPAHEGGRARGPGSPD